MGNFVYRIRDDTLSHAYTSKYANSSSSVAGYDPVKRHERYMRTKPIVGRERTRRTSNPYGNYKSPYYDPVARRERYLRERGNVRPYGVGDSTGKKGKSGSGGKGKAGGKSGKGRKGGKAANANLAKQIKSLREQSAKETERQREKSANDIQILKDKLSAQISKLKGSVASKNLKEKNLAEIRGRTQTLRATIENLQGKTADEIKSEQQRLGAWIKDERASLERRIAALYESAGKKYTPRYQD